jgi:hypothetical protein
MRIFTVDLFPQAFVEHVLNANIFLSSSALLHTECHYYQAVENDSYRDRCVKHSAVNDVIDSKGSDDQRGNDKFDNAENNAVKNIMCFDSVYHGRSPMRRLSQPLPTTREGHIKATKLARQC